MNTLWQSPDDATAVLVLAHGAGAGMTHRNMQSLADAFARRQIATLRFNFPFIDAGRRHVDSKAISTATIAEACGKAAKRSSLPLWLGGHSFGGRMASHAVLDEGLEPAGVVLCSFPLHPPGKPGTGRAAHLCDIRLPMLFLSGTRDTLAGRDLLEPMVSGLPAATLHWLDTADHGYRILKRSRGTEEDVFDEMARIACGFMSSSTRS
jgi:predicted alpha/beta-hydrolase family hydrolase